MFYLPMTTNQRSSSSKNTSTTSTSLSTSARCHHLPSPSWNALIMFALCASCPNLRLTQPVTAHWGITAVDLRTGSVGCALAECMMVKEQTEQVENGTALPNVKQIVSNNFLVNDYCRVEALVGVVQGAGEGKSTFSVDVAFEYLRLRRSVREVSRLQRYVGFNANVETICTAHEGCQKVSVGGDGCDRYGGNAPCEKGELYIGPEDSNGMYAAVFDGSMVTSKDVLELARNAFLTTNGTLADRLMVALHAGKSNGDGNSKCVESRYSTDAPSTASTSDIVSFKIRHAWNTEVVKEASELTGGQPEELFLPSDNCQDLTFLQIHKDGVTDAVDSAWSWYYNAWPTQTDCGELQTRWDAMYAWQQEQQNKPEDSRKLLRQSVSDYMIPPPVPRPTKYGFKTEVVPTAVTLNYQFEREMFIETMLQAVYNFGIQRMVGEPIQALQNFASQMVSPAEEQSSGEPLLAIPDDDENTRPLNTRPLKPNVSIHFSKERHLVQLSYKGLLMQKTYFFLGSDAEWYWTQLNDLLRDDNDREIAKTALLNRLSENISKIARILPTSDTLYTMESLITEPDRTEEDMLSWPYVDVGPLIIGGDEGTENPNEGDGRVDGMAGGNQTSSAPESSSAVNNELPLWVVVLLSGVSGCICVGLLMGLCTMRCRNAKTGGAGVDGGPGGITSGAGNGSAAGPGGGSAARGRAAADGNASNPLGGPTADMATMQQLPAYQVAGAVQYLNAMKRINRWVDDTLQYLHKYDNMDVGAVSVSRSAVGVGADGNGGEGTTGSASHGGGGNNIADRRHGNNAHHVGGDSRTYVATIAGANEMTGSGSGGSSGNKVGGSNNKRPVPPLQQSSTQPDINASASLNGVNGYPSDPHQQQQQQNHQQQQKQLQASEELAFDYDADVSVPSAPQKHYARQFQKAQQQQQQQQQRQQVQQKQPSRSSHHTVAMSRHSKATSENTPKDNTLLLQQQPSHAHDPNQVVQYITATDTAPSPHQAPPNNEKHGAHMEYGAVQQHQQQQQQQQQTQHDRDARLQEYIKTYVSNLQQGPSPTSPPAVIQTIALQDHGNGSSAPDSSNVPVGIVNNNNNNAEGAIINNNNANAMVGVGVPSSVGIPPPSTSLWGQQQPTSTTTHSQPPQMMQMQVTTSPPSPPAIDQQHQQQQQQLLHQYNALLQQQQQLLMQQQQQQHQHQQSTILVSQAAQGGGKSIDDESGGGGPGGAGPRAQTQQPAVLPAGNMQTIDHHMLDELRVREELEKRTREATLSWQQQQQQQQQQSSAISQSSGSSRPHQQTLHPHLNHQASALSAAFGEDHHQDPDQQQRETNARERKRLSLNPHIPVIPTNTSPQHHQQQQTNSASSFNYQQHLQNVQQQPQQQQQFQQVFPQQQQHHFHNGAIIGAGGQHQPPQQQAVLVPQPQLPAVPIYSNDISRLVEADNGVRTSISGYSLTKAVVDKNRRIGGASPRPTTAEQQQQQQGSASAGTAGTFANPLHGVVVGAPEDAPDSGVGVEQAVGDDDDDGVTNADAYSIVVQDEAATNLASSTAPVTNTHMTGGAQPQNQQKLQDFYSMLTEAEASQQQHRIPHPHQPTTLTPMAPVSAAYGSGGAQHHQHQQQTPLMQTQQHQFTHQTHPGQQPHHPHSGNGVVIVPLATVPANQNQNNNTAPSINLNHGSGVGPGYTSIGTAQQQSQQPTANSRGPVFDEYSQHRPDEGLQMRSVSEDDVSHHEDQPSKGHQQQLQQLSTAPVGNRQQRSQSVASAQEPRTSTIPVQQKQQQQQQQRSSLSSKLMAGADQNNKNNNGASAGAGSSNGHFLSAANLQRNSRTIMNNATKHYISSDSGEDNNKKSSRRRYE